MSIDVWLDKSYDDSNYNCLHFVRDVWLAETGFDLAGALEDLYGASYPPRVTRVAARVFRELPGPVSPCLVVMQRPKASPHWGVFLRGRVLHIQRSGPEFFPVKIATRGFTRVRFALPC